MTTFRTCLRIVARRWPYMLIYLVLISQIGLFGGLSVDRGQDQSLRQDNAKVVVVDHDGSVVSQGVKDYLDPGGRSASVTGERASLQDAVAQNRADYILLVPSGYGEHLARAAQEGSAPPALEAVVNQSDSEGILADQRLHSYLNQVYDYLAVGAYSPEQAVALTAAAMEQDAPAELIRNESGAVPESLVVYAKMSTYPLLTATCVSIAVMMVALNRRPVRSRVLASPQASRSRSLGLLGACLAVGAVCWTWVCVLGLVVLGGSHLAGSAPLLGVVGLALGSYTLFGVALGYLLGSTGVGQGWADAVANITGMVLTFLAGAWVPTQWLPPAVAAASRLTPAYWSTQAVQGAYEALDSSPTTLWPLLVDCGVCALFAVALTCVALMVGRNRARASL